MKSLPFPSPTSITVLTFGITSFALGIATIVLPPASIIETLQVSPDALPAVRASSLAATAMGIYYTLATYQGNTAFFAWTVPMRLLTTAVMWNQGWKGTALWEGAGAISTAIALAWDLRGGKSDGGKGGRKTE